MRAHGKNTFKKKTMNYGIYIMTLVTLVGYSDTSLYIITSEQRPPGNRNYTIYRSHESLQCYSCSNVANIDVCNVTRLCLDGQSCYHNFTSGKHSLGCVDNKKCDAHAAVPSIVGRGLVSTSTCFECCSTDNCSSALCRHSESKVCMDDESVDCARMNSLFSICSDITHARSVCAKFCGLCTVDGNWSVWSSWSTCDVTCGNGHQTKTRTCTNPAPKNGGHDCGGASIMTKLCKNDSPYTCPVHGGWSDWSHWGTCSATCGIGQERRSRTCSNPPPSLAGNHCFGDNTETQICMPAPCANGGWSVWSSWSTCSATCGGGIRSQFRSCSNQHPSPYGQYCVGSNDRVELCANDNCAHETNCYDILHSNKGRESGIYNITLWRSKIEMEIYCDMETDLGGWTVFQNRFNGSVNFYRNFTEYVNGFGNLTGEFWLGLKYLEEMTAQGPTELRIELIAADNSNAYEVFQHFYIGTHPEYMLHIDKGTGTAGDNGSGLSYHNGQPFSTYDHDNSNGCASSNRGGWWYDFCALTNLNGEYFTPGSDHGTIGMTYLNYKGHESLKSSRMMFRRM